MTGTHVLHIAGDVDLTGAADAGKGKIVFDVACKNCHQIEAEKGRKEGSNLWGVVGRDKASLADAKYSDTLLAWEGAWNYEDLNTFLSGPMATTPGVTMQVRGIPDEADRVNLIAYLRTLSDKPVPLP